MRLDKFPKWKRVVVNTKEGLYIPVGEAATAAEILDIVKHRAGLYNYFSEGMRDYWKTPQEFIYDGGEDCEDYAIFCFYGIMFIKHKFLIPEIVLCTVKSLRQTHAACVVEVPHQGKYVLDCRYKKLLTWDEWLIENEPLVFLTEMGGRLP